MTIKIKQIKIENKIKKSGSSYFFRIPKHLISCGILDPKKKYIIFIDEKNLSEENEKISKKKLKNKLKITKNK